MTKRRFLFSAVAIAAAATVGSAQAHDLWINHGGYTNPVTGSSCCGRHDCVPIESTQAWPNSSGWFLPATGETIPYAEVLTSEDGKFWRCRYLSGQKAGRTRCLFVPPMGS